MVFEDRVAKYPGRWTMVKPDGASEVITLVRNDEPTKEGTPINAATLNELSTVAGAINAKEEAVTAAQTATSERAKAEQAATNAANEVKADLKEYSDNAASSAAAAATSESNAKTSETESAKNLQGTKEYFEQVRTITIGAQGWYATPEALKAAVPVGENGWWAVVGTTDTIWTWDNDTKSWKDSIQKADLSDYYTKAQADAKFGTPYALPPATADQLGGVKVGDYLDIAADGTLSGKTLNDKIAAAVAVKSEPRLVWNHHEETGKRWKTYDIKMPDGLDYVHVKTRYNGPVSSYGEEVDIAKGGTVNHNFGNGTGIFASNTTFRTDGTLHFATETSTGGYTVEIWLTGYHYPTLAELLTETQAAQADTDALAVDQEYRVAMLELGLTDDTTTDTTT